MVPFKKVLVCLDLSEIDEPLIGYVEYFLGVFQEIEELIFVHNIRFDYPDDALEVAELLEHPLDETLQSILDEKIRKGGFSRIRKKNPKVIIKEAKSTPKVLAEVANTEKIDLIFLGKKINYAGSGLTAERLIRLVSGTTSVLLVPETSHHSIQNVLLPIDFSKASGKAIETGMYIQNQTNAEMACQHVFNIPVHYFPYIVVGNLEKKMQQEAQNEWEAYKKRNPVVVETGLTCHLTFSRGNNISQSIFHYALKNQIDLIIMSTKGKGAITSMAIGSVANRVIQLDFHIPLLIQKVL